MARGNRTTRRLRWALLLVGVAVVVLVGFTGYQALKARTALKQVAADFDTLSGQLTSGDQAGARRTLADAQQHAQEHEPEADAHRPAGPRPADSEDAGQGVVGDAHEKQRREPDHLAVAAHGRPFRDVKGHIDAYREEVTSRIEKVRGIDIIVTTTAKTDEEARELLRLFNFPFPPEQQQEQRQAA